MVGNHYRLAVEGFCQHYRQPIPAGGMQPDSIFRTETPTVILDDGKVCHLLHGEELVSLTEQAEVSPQDAAEKPHAIDDYLIVVQNADVCSRACSFSSSIRAMSW